MTGIVITFAVPSEGYQAMTELRRASGEGGFTIAEASLVRRTSEGVELLDAIGTDDVVLSDEASRLGADTVAILALVDEAEAGTLEAAVSHLDATVAGINLDEAEREARKRARHEARVKRVAGALAALKAKGKAAEAALDDFADAADERKTATDERLQAKVDAFAERMEARLERTHEALVADLATIARAVDEEPEAPSAPEAEDVPSA
jgi:hypothetical protein